MKINKSAEKLLLTSQQIADHFGVTAFTISRWIQRKGMPVACVRRNRKRGHPAQMFSLPDCQRWADLLNVRTAGKDAPEKILAPPLREEIPATTLGRIESGELAAWESYADAESAGKPSAARLRLWLKWCDALAVFYRLALKNGEGVADMTRQIIVEVNQFLSEWRGPVVGLCETLPDAVAKKVNPQDPSAAATVLRDFFNNQFLPMLNRSPFPLSLTGANTTNQEKEKGHD